MGFLYQEKAVAVSSLHGINKDVSLEKEVTLFLDDEDLSNKRSRCSLEEYESDDREIDQQEQQRSIYWESQMALLQEIIERCSFSGSKFRQEVIRIIDLVRETKFCNCTFKPSCSEGCFPCLRRKVVASLCNKGFKASLRNSQWNRTRKYPGGSHEYIEVIASSSRRKKGVVAVLVELEFRDQFQLAKACKEYTELTCQLPEIFIGKMEYLTAMVRLLCEAGKESMKKKKIHMGPWRKTGFMQMKWSGLNQTGDIEESQSTTRPDGSGSRLQVCAALAVLVS